MLARPAVAAWPQGPAPPPLRQAGPRGARRQCVSLVPKISKRSLYSAQKSRGFVLTSNRRLPTMSPAPTSKVVGSSL